MRFFTPALLSCEDDGAFEEAERAYGRHLESLQGRLPESVWRYEAEASIHDAVVQRLVATEDRLDVFLEAWHPQAGHHLLELCYERPSHIGRIGTVLSECKESRAEALYDEFDLAGECLIHRVLFTKRRELEIACRSFDFSTSKLLQSGSWNLRRRS